MLPKNALYRMLYYEMIRHSSVAGIVKFCVHILIIHLLCCSLNVELNIVILCPLALVLYHQHAFLNIHRWRINLDRIFGRQTQQWHRGVYKIPAICVACCVYMTVSETYSHMNTTHNIHHYAVCQSHWCAENTPPSK